MIFPDFKKTQLPIVLNDEVPPFSDLLFFFLLITTQFHGSKILRILRIYSVVKKLYPTIYLIHEAIDNLNESN